jgi:import inner membrane translocase subunit TIM16
MSGILARAVAQTVIFMVSVVSKTFAAALTKAQNGGQAASAGMGSAAGRVVSGNRMALDQARQVLNVEKAYTRAQVQENFEKIFEANDPDKGGSFYIQGKVISAKETLLACLKEYEEEAKRAAGKKEKEKMS